MRTGLTMILLIATFGATACTHAHAATAPAKRVAARPQAQATEIRQATPRQAASYLQATPEAQFIDVRTPEEYAESRARGAALRPLADLATWAPKLDKERPVVLICRSGNRSMKAVTALAERGFETLVNIQGGTLAWEKDGTLPMEYGPPKH